MLIYFIYMFGKEGVTPTKVALLLMPMVIELTLGKVMATMMVIGTKLLFTIIVAEGEMMALTWIEPLLTQLILIGIQPPSKPPEAREYLKKATRLGRRGEWSALWDKIGSLLAPLSSVVTRLGNRGMSKNEARSSDRSSGAERKRGTHYNRRMSKCM
jgi:hypothetical protein